MMYGLSSYFNLYYLTGLLISLAFYGFVIWCYFDLKKYRSKGVPVSPGWIAGFLLLANYIIGLLPRFWFYSGGGSHMVNILIPILIPVGLASSYFYLRHSKYDKIVLQQNPPLPPASVGGKIFFIILLLVTFVPGVLALASPFMSGLLRSLPF